MNDAAAKSAADTALAALQAADNAIFVANTDFQIAGAIALGLYQTAVLTWGNVDPKYAFNYYTNLGYKVILPDMSTTMTPNPAQLFGFFWEEFWNNQFVLLDLKNPVRMLISWKN